MTHKTHENSFHFSSGEHSGGTTVLTAVMSDFSYAKHAHEEIALGVTVEGVQEFHCKGSWFRSEPGNIILFNPGDVHNGNPGDDDALKYTMLYIDPEEFLPLTGCAADNEKKQCRLRETHFDDPILRSLILQTATIIADSGKSSLDYDAGLYEIAKRFTQRRGVYVPDAWSSYKDALMMTVRDYIHDTIEEDITIDDLCRVANLSKFHLIRLFRTQFGLTPHRYIVNHRINRVRSALKTGTAPTDVAVQFGFFDVSHLNRHFKRSFGITPKQYQTQLMR